ncbi:MAG TPA: tetratricopeptide repeat protein [Alphaproteobacteria bacterium]|nr:tetratricopeptide repeat protein [Alphaproteobacteria bacterium]
MANIDFSKKLRSAENRITAGDIDEGERIYRRILALDPENVLALVNLGGLLIAGAENSMEAAALSQRAVALDPENSVALVNLGVSQLHCGELEAACEAFCGAIEVNADLVLAHERRARTLILLGRLEEAPTAARAAPPRDRSTHFRKGQVDEWREVFTPEQSLAASQAMPADLCARFGWTC